MKQKLDHHQAAQDAADLDACFHALARIGRRRGHLDPIAGTIDRALIDAHEALQEFRGLADAAAVAAGLCSPFVRRDLRAGPELQAQARTVRLAQLEEEERVLEERRHRTWRGASNPPCAGPSTKKSATGDDDHPGSLHTDLPTGDSSAAARAGDANASDPVPDHPKATDAA